MRKFKWSTDLYDSDGEEITGHFELDDDYTLQKPEEVANTLAMREISVRCWEVTRPTGPVDWTSPIEVVHFMEEEEEVGNARFLGVSQSEGEYTQIVGIAWNPPHERITFALPRTGKVKGEEDVYIRNATRPPKQDTPTSINRDPQPFWNNRVEATSPTSFTIPPLTGMGCPNITVEEIQTNPQVTFTEEVNWKESGIEYLKEGV